MPDEASSQRGVFIVKPIGLIHTSFPSADETPIQPIYGMGTLGEVVVDEGYEPALEDIEGFERIWLVYLMDRAGPYRPRVTPYRDTREHGLFATRSPSRPNPIGISVVRLLERVGCRLKITDVDILDGTPLLDIKPYVPDFDAHPGAKAGWFDDSGVDRRVADGRFHPT